MSETPTIAPIWRYVPNDYSEKSITDIHLIIWRGGVCVAGFQEGGIQGVVQTYLTQKQPDVLWVKELAEQDVFLKKYPKKVKKIWISEERNLLVPNSIYEENHAESWVRKFHYLSPDEILLHFELNSSVDAKIVFPVSESLKAFLTENFSKAEFKAVSDLAFRSVPNDTPADVRIVCLPREIILTVGHNGHFVYHLVYPYETPQDVLYKLALILEEKGINQAQVNNISFSGIAPFWNNILEEISFYFPLKTSSENTTEISLTFLKSLYTCA